MSDLKWATPAQAISLKSSAVLLVLRQRSSVARFSFPQDCDRGRRIAREGFRRLRQGMRNENEHHSHWNIESDGGNGTGRCRLIGTNSSGRSGCVGQDLSQERKG